MSKMYKLRFVDYGKIHKTSSRGAGEFQALDRSDDSLAIYRGRCDNYYRKELSQTKNPTGHIAISFTPWENQSIYLFSQIQSRREDEFIVGEKKDTIRAYNQVRLTIISSQDVLIAFRNKLGLYSAVFYQNPEYPLGEGRLKDYVDSNRVEKLDKGIELLSVPMDEAPNKQLLEGIVNRIYFEWYSSSQKSIQQNNFFEKPLIFKLNTTLSMGKKLKTMDAIQYLLYPVLQLISFAIDIFPAREFSVGIFDNQSVANSGIDGNNVSIFTEEDILKLLGEQNYFSVLNELPPEQLYDETLVYYLQRKRKPAKALQLFHLIETNKEFTLQEEIAILSENFPIIQKDHLNKILRNRFHLPEKMCGLLQNNMVPRKLRYFALDFLVESDVDLVGYVLLHMAAIDGEIDQKYQTELRKKLQQVIAQNSMPGLNKLPQGLEKNIFLEMLLADAEYKNREATLYKNRAIGLEFSGDAKTSRETVWQVLVGQPGTYFVEILADAFNKGFLQKQYLAEELSRSMEKGWVEWNPDDVLLLYSACTKKILGWFVILLRYLIIDHNYPLISAYPNSFQEFLIQSISDFETENSKFLIDIVKDRKDIDVSELRLACLAASIPISDKNIEFSKWWFADELAQTDIQMFEEDFTKLLEIFDGYMSANIDNEVSHFLYLVTAGRLGDNKSIAKACEKIFDKEGFKKIYNSVVSGWISQDKPIPNTDIRSLIDLLPDDTEVNKLLAKIVLDGKQDQLNALKTLPSQVALKWLRNTQENNLRAPYILNGQDKLFKSLKKLKKPTIKLIRHLVMVDPGCYSKKRPWIEYINDASNLYEDAWGSKSSGDAVIEDFIALVGQIKSDALQTPSIFPIINKMAGYRNETNHNQDVFDDRALELLIGISTAEGGEIKNRADEILVRFWSASDRSSLCEKLFPESPLEVEKYISEINRNLLEKIIIENDVDDSFIEPLNVPDQELMTKRDHDVFPESDITLNKSKDIQDKMPSDSHENYQTGQEKLDQLQRLFDNEEVDTPQGTHDFQVEPQSIAKVVAEKKTEIVNEEETRQKGIDQKEDPVSRFRSQPMSDDQTIRSKQKPPPQVSNVQRVTHNPSEEIIKHARNKQIQRAVEEEQLEKIIVIFLVIVAIVFIIMTIHIFFPNFFPCLFKDISIIFQRLFRRGPPRHPWC
jgi:hypothetical protein